MKGSRSLILALTTGPSKSDKLTTALPSTGKVDQRRDVAPPKADCVLVGFCNFSSCTLPILFRDNMVAKVWTIGGF